jgi:hypothetical protein
MNCEHDMTIEHLKEDDYCGHRQQCWCCHHTYCCDSDMTLCVTGFNNDDSIKSWYVMWSGQVCNFICNNCYNPELKTPVPICPDCLCHIKESTWPNMWPDEIKSYNEIIYYLKRHGYTDDLLKKLGITDILTDPLS